MAKQAGTPDIHRAETFLDPKWIASVAQTPEIDLRSHKVTLTYSKLAEHLDTLLYGDDSARSRFRHRRSVKVYNANWFHFATWATATVTRNIANERPPQRIDTLPSQALRRHITPVLLQQRASSGQRVGRALSWAQRLIFVSACLTLKHLDWWLQRGVDYEPANFELPASGAAESGVSKTQIIGLGTWDGREWIQERRHLEVIEHAFRFFIHAREAQRGEPPDPERGARCILGANVLLAAVDQDLIDRAIETVVNHVPRRVAARADNAIAMWVERFRGVPRQLTTLNLPFRHTIARTALETAWSRLMTDQVLVMALPTETLRLGRDIPLRYVGRPYFPPALCQLGAGGEAPLAEVATLVNSLDRTTGAGRGSAARDWRRWDERMNWAVTLMRSRQQDETLFWSPYSREDQLRIVSDQLPKRAGDPSVLEVQPPGDGIAFAAMAEEGRFP